jgi:hypothetical protein
MTQEYILYIETRSLPLERDAEIDAARKNGFEVVLATSSVAEYASYELKHLIQTSLIDEKRAFDDILSYIQEHNLQIRGVIGWTDPSVVLVSRLSDALGLPGTSPELVHNVRNKANTRRILAQHLPEANPVFAFVNEENNIWDALEKVGFPCVLKPAGSSNGRGIFKIRSFQEAEQQVANFYKTVRPENDPTYGFYQNEFIVEQELIGTEHSVAGVVVDNQPIIMSIIDKDNDFTIPIQYQNITPSLLPIETQRSMVEMAKQAVNLMGINWCGFHVDMMVVHGQPKILEIGGRLGGECINSHLIPLSNPTLKPYDCIIQVIQGQNPFTKDQYFQDAVFNAGTRALLPPQAGYLSVINGLEAINSHPSVRGVNQLRQVGDQVYLPLEKYNTYAVAYVVAQCEQDRSIRTILDELDSFLHVEIVSSPT